MTQPARESSRGTSPEDYELTYYASHLGEQDYGWETESWREFFRRVATRVVSITSPTTVLDVGCARGLLVQALREEDVDAVGFDVSRHAVGAAHGDVREHLWVQSATQPITGHYDLVTCIEVLEHMSPVEADQAIDRLCEASDLVLFSSSPGDFAESTHVNVRPTSEWVTAFAERGFYRRTDVSLDFLTGWAVLLAKEPMRARDVVARYETQYAALHDEVLGKRSALLGAHRELGRLHASVNDPDAALRLEKDRAEFTRRVAEAEGSLRHAERQLAGRDQQIATLERLVASLEAQIHFSDLRIAELCDHAARARAAEKTAKRSLRRTRKRFVRTRRQLKRQRVHARRTERQLAAVMASRTYRLAGVLERPARVWDRTKRALRPRSNDGGERP